MQCPYCKDRMRKGYIQSSDRLSWTPIEEDFFALFKWSKSKNGVKISDFNFPYSRTEAYYCDKCKKVIIDTLS